MTAPLFLTESSDLPPSVRNGETLTVPASVVRHAFKSMRLAEGDALDLSDGVGRRLEVEAIDPAQGLVRVVSDRRENPPAVRLGLVQALAKSGRDEQAIEMSTEIGVDVIVPWQANRSIVQWKTGREDKALAKWRQTLVSATEQSRRAFIPELRGKMTSRQLQRFIERESRGGGLVVVLHQDATDTWGGVEERVRSLAANAMAAGTAVGNVVAEHACDIPAANAGAGDRASVAVPTVWVVVGPEGGISEEEVGEFVRAGAHAAVIGSNILRASSAGPVALTLLSRVLGRY